jgi:prepilin-type N-terminal cleavage/methylation domain-containing protein
MHPINRRGFTLIELTVALVLLGIVATGLYSVLVSNQRTYHAQTQRIDLQQNIRAAATILPSEFRELAASEGDIYAMGPTEIRMRALRQFGVLCRAPVLGGGTGALPVIVFRNLFSGLSLVRGDSILLYYEGDEATRNDDSWVAAALTTDAVNAVCPDAFASPGLAFTVALENTFPDAVRLNRDGAIPNGGPMRGFQPVRYALYLAADGLWYLGLDVFSGGVWAGIQPLVGPLSGSTGLRFNYFDNAAVATADPLRVGMIEVKVSGRTQEQVKAPGGGTLTIPVDSLTTRVALRNNRRFGPPPP